MVEKRPGDKVGVIVSLKNLDTVHSFNIETHVQLGEKTTVPATLYPLGAGDTNKFATTIPAGGTMDIGIPSDIKFWLTVPNAVMSTPVDVYVEVVDTALGTVVASGWFTDQITILKANISIIGITVY